MERLQTGQDRSSTSKVIRLNTVPAGQRYAMVMPSYFSRLSMLNAKKPSPHHHDMQGKTILAFRRIVQKFDYTTHEKLKEAVEKQLFEERRDTIKLTIASRSPDTEQLRKLNEVIETLVTREGYCAECANELLKYVSSLLAREK